MHQEKYPDTFGEDILNNEGIIPIISEPHIIISDIKDSIARLFKLNEKDIGLQHGVHDSEKSKKIRDAVAIIVYLSRKTISSENLTNYELSRKLETHIPGYAYRSFYVWMVDVPELEAKYGNTYITRSQDERTIEDIKYLIAKYYGFSVAEVRLQHGGEKSRKAQITNAARAITVLAKKTIGSKRKNGELATMLSKYLPGYSDRTIYGWLRNKTFVSEVEEQFGHIQIYSPEE